MKITWSSRKGMARKLNSDAAALAYVGDYLIAVVVDAAEKPCGNRWLFGMSPEGKRLAAWWADHCTQALRTRFSSAGLGSTLGLAVVAGFGMVILLSALI